jgi:hypothetical protein
MEQRSVHHGPLPFTTGTADQPIRPPQAAVHDGSLRMVTSLVTSHPRATAPAREAPARYRPSARPDSARTETAPACGPRWRVIALTRGARTRPAAPEPRRTAHRAAAAGTRPPGLREPDAVPAPRPPAGSARRPGGPHTAAQADARPSDPASTADRRRGWSWC